MADYQGSQQADQMQKLPTPQPGETYSTRSAHRNSQAEETVPTDSFNAPSSYSNDTLTIKDSALLREISSIPSLFEVDMVRPNTYKTDTFEDKRQVLDAYASDLAEGIWSNVEQLGVRREHAEALSHVLPYFLHQMAFRLGHGSASSEERDAQAFVHRNTV